MVYILDGKADITIGDEQFQLKKGETTVMPAEISHALLAAERFKMLLFQSLKPISLQRITLRESRA